MTVVTNRIKYWPAEHRNVCHDNLIKVEPERWTLPKLLNMNAQSCIRKMDEIEVILNEQQIDFACITESWAGEEVPDGALRIDNYSFPPIRWNRKDRQGGGVVCYVHNNVPYERLLYLNSELFEAVWIKLRPHRLPRNFCPIIIGAIYHPPDQNKYETVQYLTSCMDSVLSKHPKAGIVLMGDFNKLPDKQLKCSYKLRQIVTKPTRGNAMLDLVYTNMHSLYQEPTLLAPVGRADHDIVLCFPLPSYSIGKAKTIECKVRKFPPNEKALFAMDLKHIRFERLYNQPSCHDMYSMLSVTLNNLMDKYFPIRTVVRCESDKEWVTDEFKDLIARRQRAYTSGNMELYRYFRNKVSRMSKGLRKYYYRNKVDKLKSNTPGKWWTCVKELTGNKTSNSLQGMANELNDGNLQELANNINSFFAMISTDLSPICPEVILALQTAGTPSEYQVTVEAMEKALLAIDCSKSPGPDGIPSWILRDFAGVLGKPLTAIFNASVREGYIPPEWKTANVTALPKVSPPQCIATDLRPVSLTPIVMKVMEGFVCQWIWDTIREKILPDQYGCMKRTGTTHALINLIHNWSSATDSLGSFVRILLIDFQKAFDHVDHSLVLQKLCDLDVHRCLVRWVASFLTGRQQRIKIGDILSTWSGLHGGVPQGTRLGPLLFLIMVNDLHSALPMVKYVDDITLYNTGNYGVASEHNSLQLAADHCLSWANENNMNINVTKTKEMVIHFSKNETNLPVLKLNDTMIERVSTTKLLGLNISNDLSWDDHVDSIYKKAARRLYSLVMLKRAGVNAKDMCVYYKAMIRPVMEYCCQVWHSRLTKAQSELLESIQKRALRIIFSSPGNNDEYGALLQGSKLECLAERRYKMCMKLFVQMQCESHKLHNLLVPYMNVDRQTRVSKNFKLPRCRTNRLKDSFIPFCINEVLKS